MAVIGLPRPLTAEAVAALLRAAPRLLGAGEREVRAVAPLGEAAAGVLTFCSAPPEAASARLAAARDCVVIADSALPIAEAEALAAERTLLLVTDPRLAFIRCTAALFGAERFSPPGIAPGAVLSPEATIGPGARIGAGAYVEHDVTIGANSIICSGAQVLAGSRLGRGVVVQNNAVIGSVGQSYEREEDGSFAFMPHLCGVVLEDGVRVGAGSVIVRGTLEDTVVGAHSVVGNHVNIGHNVTVAPRCHIGAGVTLCGSSRIGAECWLSIGTIVCSVTLGSGVMTGVGAIVTRPVEAGMMVNGNPARVTPRINRFNRRAGR